MRGMSASTTSGLYLRLIISSVIESEKFAVNIQTKTYNTIHSVSKLKFLRAVFRRQWATSSFNEWTSNSSG